MAERVDTPHGAASIAAKPEAETSTPAEGQGQTEDGAASPPETEQESIGAVQDRPGLPPPGPPPSHPPPPPPSRPWSHRLRDHHQNFITQSELYPREEVREIDVSKHTLHIDGNIHRKLHFSMKMLRDQFIQHEVICPIRPCGPLRPSQHLSNYRWSGPRLRDVINRCILPLSDRDSQTRAWIGFAHFISADRPPTLISVERGDQHNHALPYCNIITLARAMDWRSDVILALYRNDRPLETKYGGPIRVIAPGVEGGRSVKWLQRISVTTRPDQIIIDFSNLCRHKRQLPEGTLMYNFDWWTKVNDAVEEVPINSVIMFLGNNGKVEADDDGYVTVYGYAVPGGGVRDGPLREVEVTGDGGHTWICAELNYDGCDRFNQPKNKHIRWSWCLWTAKVKVAKGSNRAIYSRAVDWMYNRQIKEPTWTHSKFPHNGWGRAENLTVV